MGIQQIKPLKQTGILQTVGKWVRVKTICILQTIEANWQWVSTIISYKQKQKTKKACPFIIFSPTKQQGKNPTEFKLFQAISVHFNQNPNANHINQINKKGERVRSRDEVAPSQVGGDRP